MYLLQKLVSSQWQTIAEYADYPSAQKALRAANAEQHTEAEWITIVVNCLWGKPMPENVLYQLRYVGDE